MGNYSRIKNVTPSWRCRVVEVGGNQGIEEGKVDHRSRRKDREAEKRSSKGIRWREHVREQDGSRLLSLSTVRRDAHAPTIVRGGLARVGSGCLGAVSWCLGGAPYHHYGLARIGNSEVFFVSLSLLFLCFVIIIKYSRAQKRTQASYPPSSSLSVALELNSYCWVTEFLPLLSV